MSIKFLMLYGIAALVMIFTLVRTHMEKEPISRKVKLLLFFGIICVSAYSVNFMTDEYMAMSIATSIMLTAQDFMLSAMLAYTFEFTRLKSRFSTVLVVICTMLAAVDSAVFIANAFYREVAVEYSMNMVDGVYVLSYEGNAWFTIHIVSACLTAVLIIGVYALKCMRIPNVYWRRYTYMIGAMILTVFVKLLFVLKCFDLRFDISILLYALLGLLVYWNTFWYSKRNMLNTTHAMIIDHMQVPVVLFDYEDVLADFNKPMSDLFGELEFDNREQTYSWFKQHFLMPKPDEDRKFQWNVNGRDYDCQIVFLNDNRDRSLGRIIVMQDVTDLKKAYVELERSITHDGLTGMYNKNSFIKKSLEYASPDTWPLSIVVCDINGLTEINSVYGRKTGDRIMVQVADIIREELDKKAYIARLDGGNIAAAFEKTKESKAALYFDKISTRVIKECSKEDMIVTIEYGIGVKEDDSVSVIKAEKTAIDSMKIKKMNDNAGRSLNTDLG
ncbi:MAG: diguanylate cyclase [Eubacteriales bacterium]|nr:diguanylate cyclase [Eubacteriales bacterium]